MARSPSIRFPKTSSLSRKAATAHYVNSIAVDAAGNLFIADGLYDDGVGDTYGNNRTRKVTPDGIITTVAGNGAMLALRRLSISVKTAVSTVFVSSLWPSTTVT
jgi:hypothetical protein